MEFKIIILMLSYGIFVLALEAHSNLQRNILKFIYGINYKCEGQLSHYIQRYKATAKFQLQKLNDIPIRLRKMSADYNTCDYLSP